MSLAWATVGILVSLLPGFLFFVGLYLPERFDRESVTGNVPSQLAAVVGVSLLVHGSALLAIDLAGAWLPGVSFEHLIEWLQLGDLGPEERRELAANLRASLPFVLIYITLTSAAGSGIGWGAGALVVRGWFSGLVPHAWIHSVKNTEDKTVIAHVLTRLRSEPRFVVYSGYPITFGLSPAGRINYIVLSGCERRYLWLDGESPHTTESNPFRGNDPDLGYLLIEGSDIINIFWDRLPWNEPQDDEAIPA